LEAEHYKKQDHHHEHARNPVTADQSANDQKKKANDDHSHDKHAGHHTGDFLKRFWICLVLTVPILLLSHMIQQWTGFILVFSGDRYVLFAFSTILYIYGGWPFLSGALREVKNKAIGMMTLVALAVSVAYFYSSAVVFGLRGMDFFWELATLIDIMLLGHWLEMRSQMAASSALESLVALLPTQVHVDRNGQVSELPLQEISNGDILLVKPGEKIPADGMVLEGETFVNESMITGESLPVKKEKNAKVIAGSVNGDGSIRMRTTGTGKDSYLNKVILLVKSAQASKSATQNLADRVAKWLTLVALLAGVATFFWWYSVERDLAFAMERMVTVMVTACPHALGVAIPLVVAISTAKAATSGLLIRNRTAFENARRISTIIFDKTGTLTKGSHKVHRVISLDASLSEDEVLQDAASAQQQSEHYIGRGMLNELKERKLELWRSSNFQYIQGVGVSALINEREVIVAGPNYFRQKNMVPPTVPEEVDQETETISYVLIDNKPVGIITLADSIRETSGGAIAALKKMNIKSYLLTGDNEKVGASVSKKLGMDGYLANVLPHQKQEKVKAYQDKGEIVAMTGDGVNDAPALAQADVGIAVGSGTDVAAETADIILVNSDPMDVVNMISFARATYRKMIQNLFWAVGYNVVAIPLAAGVLYPRFVLSPAMGAVLMSLSTIIVAANAQLLRKSLKHKH